MLLLIWMQPRRREAAAMFLAAAWNVPALLAVNLLAQRMGWWRFEAEGGTLLRVPVDLLLGWALLWGPLAGFVALRMRLLWVVLFAVGFDLALMPLCAPVLQLGRYWLAGEAVAVVVCLVPALYFCRWTARNHHLPWRAGMQMITFVGLFIFVIPAALLQATNAVVLPWGWREVLLLQLVGLVALPGVSAVVELVRHGGTPFPYDTPQRLATTGPYAYVRNPMQLSTTLLFLALGWLMQSWPLAAGAVITFSYSAGLAWWHEAQELEPRWGEPWRRYRAAVRSWLPRWKPYARQPAHLYVAASCGVCRAVGNWFHRRGATNMDILPAEEHPSRNLERITYECGDEAVDGIAAIARALERINLGWAMVGFLIALPGIRHTLQLASDATIGKPGKAHKSGGPESTER